MQAEPKGGPAMIDAVCATTSGTILGKGIVTRKAVTYTRRRVRCRDDHAASAARANSCCM